MTITALPSLDRTSATFKADVDTFFGSQLPTFCAEANALQVAVNADAVSAADSASVASSGAALVDVAAASANYKGHWSALTGALNIPASVSHNGYFWALNANLANVTTATPGVSGSWTALRIGTGGATETSSAVNVTLTYASARVQAVAMTVADKSVNLPSATVLSVGAELFVVKNTGALAFAVRDGAGGLLTNLRPGKCVALHLSNNGTTAGSWVLSGDSFADTIYQATALSVTATASSMVSVTALSATQSIATWYNASGFLTTCTLNISGTTVTAGTVLTTGSTLGNACRTKVVALSATQALVVYTAVTTTYLMAMTLNVSGTTVTAGTALAVSSLATGWLDLTKMSATQAIVVYPGTTSYGEARTLNISGTTVTAGSACVVLGSAATPGCVAGLSATLATASYVASGILIYHYLLTVSGTTITAGATPALTSAGTSALSATTVSSTQTLVSSNDPTVFTPRYVLLEISGATVVVKDMIECQGTLAGNRTHDIVQISANRFMALHGFKGGNGLTWKAGLQFVSVIESQIIPAPEYETVKNSALDATRLASLCTLSATKLLAVYSESTGYIQTRVLEIGA